MTTRILLRRGNASTWSSSNPVLSTGELGFETDTYRFKIGDGQKNWANLSYFYPNVNTTSNVLEGVNLYFTNARVQSFIENLEYSIVPKDDEVVSLGTPSKKFANLYLSGNTLVLGSATIKSSADGTISISSSNANVSGFISLSSNGFIASSNSSFDTSNLATITHVSNEIANLINAAPSALDTLNELAGALGNDASFSTTVVNALSNKANTASLTTANVSELNNLYFTNARVYANVSPILDTKANVADLTSSNVSEGTNLYFTNARVYANVSPILDLKANVSDLTTANVVELNSLYFTNARVYANVSPILDIKANVADLTTSNVSEGTNLYYTNARVYANVSPILDLKANVSDLTTANVSELNNLYFTNARVYANVSPILDLKANVADLTTSNVSEGTNLYYTNARVYANVSPILDIKANVADLTTSNVSEGTNLYFTNARVYANVSPILDLKANVSDLTTANVSELNNLYFTNARVYANVSPILDTKANITDLTTANIAELNNLYYTNERTYSNISPILDSRARKAISPGTGVSYDNTTGVVSIGQSVGTSASVEFKDLTITGNVTFAGNATTINSESISITDNMIYLNEARAENITNAVGDGANITYTVEGTHTGQAGQVIRVTGVNPSAYNIPYTTIIASTANTVTVASANTGSYVSGGNAFIKALVNPDLGFSGGYNDGTYHHAGLFRDATDGHWKFFENYGPEPDSNVYIDTSHPTFALANVSAKTFYGNIGGGSSNSLIVQSSTDRTTFVASPAIDYTYLRYDAANGITWGSLFEANSIVYTANSIILDPSYGTYNSGNILSIQTVGDYNLDSNNYYSINETATTPGYIAYIDFTNVQNFNRILINLFYTQNSSHVIYVDLKNKDTLDWDSFGTYNGLGTYYQFALSVIDPTSYIQAGNLVELRLYHASGGNTNHNHRIDYVALELSNQGPQGPKGTTGSTGATGAGVATGGTAGQVLLKANSDNYATYWGDPTTSNISEGTNLYYTNARVYANVSPILDTKANVADLTTSNVSEGTNLYYTNARVYANVSPILDTKANVADLTTSNVSEGTNLYFTNARVYANIGPLLNTSNVSELNNLYFTNARSIAALSAGTGITIESNGMIISTALGGVTSVNGANGAVILNTSNIAESGNLYYTNDRVYANIGPLLNTSNVSELNNLYFTNSRAVGALTAGTGIVIDANGLITSTAVGSSYGDSNVYSNVTTLLPSYTGNIKAGAYLDSNNRRLLIRDANSVIVWGG